MTTRSELRPCKASVRGGAMISTGSANQERQLMRILLVEDEKKVASFIARALRENAYAVGHNLRRHSLGCPAAGPEWHSGLS